MVAEPITTSTVEEIVATPDTASRLTLLDQRRTRLVEPRREAVRGLWDDEVRLFARYRVAIRCTGWLMGGTPKDPQIIAGWLRAKAGVTDDEELLEATRASLLGQGVDIPANATFAQMQEASEAIADERKGNGFLRDHRGLLFEGRKLKSGLKESTAILYPYQGGHRAGATRKAPQAYLAERVFIEEELIALGRPEPDHVHLQVGQVSGPTGKRSTLTYYDAVLQPTLEFTIMSTEDCVSVPMWQAILSHLQENGVGAVRSQSFGKFKVVAFDKVGEAAPLPGWDGPSKPDAAPKKAVAKKDVA
jgi:hypothetical protein